jgi:hypothetical protein
MMMLTCETAIMCNCFLILGNYLQCGEKRNQQFKDNEAIYGAR